MPALFDRCGAGLRVESLARDLRQIRITPTTPAISGTIASLIGGSNLTNGEAVADQNTFVFLKWLAIVPVNAAAQGVNPILTFRNSDSNSPQLTVRPVRTGTPLVWNGWGWQFKIRRNPTTLLNIDLDYVDSAAGAQFNMCFSFYMWPPKKVSTGVLPFDND